MKVSFRLARRRALTRAEAWGCFTANLAMPGAGSLAAGRAVGYVQLLLGLGGMALSLITGVGAIQWGVQNWTRLNSPAETDPFAVFLELWQHMRWPLFGILLFGLALGWAAITGWLLVASAPKEEPPPRIVQ